ncbi:MAG TPA: hypothetical protein VFO40_04345 [Chthoniobacterales bacterium]|nr:hypothetical protein [Chthoniobacterales bacterium]
MKRILVSAAVVGLFATVTIISNSPLKGDDNDRNRGDREREDEGELEVQTGFQIVPPNIKLNLKGKDIELVGLGSYIVNAQGGCNDCHTCPSYAPGHNPFPPPVGVSGDGQINSANYLAGGVPFGVAVSANLTPDATGKPAGLTLEQFQITIRTGHDPVRNDNLTIMPWPIYRHMTGRDLDAIYAYLSALPSATPGSCTGAGQ